MGVRFLIDKAFQRLLQLIYYLQSNVPFCSRINKAKVNKTKHTNSILIQRMQIYLFILPHIDRKMFYWKKVRKLKTRFKYATTCFQDYVLFIRTTLFPGIFLKPTFLQENWRSPTLHFTKEESTTGTYSFQNEIKNYWKPILSGLISVQI